MDSVAGQSNYANGLPSKLGTEEVTVQTNQLGVLNFFVFKKSLKFKSKT